MVLIFIRATNNMTGAVVGYRFHNKVIFDGKKATSYINPSSARVGLLGARKNWPQYSWDAVDRWGLVIDLGPVLKQTFTREEVWSLVLRERAGCAAVCEDEERIRTQAGMTNSEESEARDRCFAAARAAENCALGIRSERPKTLKELECEAKPSTR